MRLTQERLKTQLRYEPEAGVFTRLVSHGTVTAGEPAGYINIKGYIEIRVSGVRFWAHRLAWLYMTGEHPKDQIDHINGVRSDNRWVNLREVTRIINAQNQRKAQRSNKIGLLGVSKYGKRFRADIWLRGKQHYLGLHATPEQAHEAYIEAKRRMHSGCTI